MFIDTMIKIVEIHSFILSAQNGALRLLWVFKRNQERGKDILRSLPMDSTSSDLPLFRTIERQGRRMARMFTYGIKISIREKDQNLTAVACRLAAESSFLHSRAVGLRLRVIPNILGFGNEKLQPLLQDLSLLSPDTSLS